MGSLINLGRQKQIKLKQKQREQILKQENCFLDEYKQMNTEQHEREKREALEKRIQSIKLRNFQEKQIIENKEAIKEEKKTSTRGEKGNKRSCKRGESHSRFCGSRNRFFSFSRNEYHTSRKGNENRRISK